MQKYELLIAIILDLLAAGAVVLPLISGVMKGFKRQLTTFITLVVATIAAYAGSAALASPVYDEFCKTEVTEACVTLMDEYDPVVLAQQMFSEHGVDISESELREMLVESGDALGKLDEIAEERGLDSNISEQIAQNIGELAESGDSDTATLAEMVKSSEIYDKKSGSVDLSGLTDFYNAAVTSPEEGGNYIEEHYLRRFVSPLIEAVLFAVIFTLVRFIMYVIFRASGVIKSGERISGADRFWGFMLGFAAAAVRLAALCLIVSSIEQANPELFNIELLPSKVFLPVFKLLF